MKSPLTLFKKQKLCYKVSPQKLKELHSYKAKYWNFKINKKIELKPFKNLALQPYAYILKIAVLNIYINKKIRLAIKRTENSKSIKLITEISKIQKTKI
jgi:hypothetical protein